MKRKIGHSSDACERLPGCIARGHELVTELTAALRELADTDAPRVADLDLIDRVWVAARGDVVNARQLDADRCLLIVDAVSTAMRWVTAEGEPVEYAARRSLDMLSHWYPEVAARIAPKDFAQAVAVWCSAARSSARDAGRSKGDRSKWRRVHALARSAGLKPPTPETLATRWKAWRRRHRREVTP